MMTKENKELLLKDLCARLFYGVKAQCGSSETNINEIVDVNVQRGQIKTRTNTYNIEDVKPYLRPMSTITRGEKAYYTYYTSRIKYGILGAIGEYLDWLNEHYFDYRDLISKDLAYIAPEGMYKF